MKTCTVHHVDAFSSVPGMGNPAGVAVDADGLDEGAMQAIAREVGFNETVFVLPSDEADYRFRYFTPGHEMPLCGHATIAAVFLLCRDRGESVSLTVETRAGVLPVDFDARNGVVSMRQAAPQFEAFSGDREALAGVLGIDASRISRKYPVVYGSTGTWTLLVPVEAEDDLAAMTPGTADFPDVLQSMPRASIHPFAVAEGGCGCDFAARHFSSPFSGTVEDPVTGTASGVMGAYAVRYMGMKKNRFIIDQGASVGRDGRVFVTVAGENGEDGIFVAGAAALVGTMSIRY